MLGIETLGYNVDAAIPELRFDVAAVLIVARVSPRGFIDAKLRRVRRVLHLSTLATRLSGARPQEKEERTRPSRNNTGIRRRPCAPIRSTMLCCS
jgi:hypothetical protein